MVPKISSDYFLSHFISGGSGKVSIFPEFAAPEFLLYFGMFGKDYAGANALHHPHYLGNAVSWWKREKDMDVVFDHLQRIYFKIMVYGNFLKDIFHLLLKVLRKYPLAVLRCPDQMVFGIVDSMAGPFQSHALYITHPGRNRKTFHPRLQGGVFKF